MHVGRLTPSAFGLSFDAIFFSPVAVRTIAPATSFFVAGTIEKLVVH